MLKNHNLSIWIFKNFKSFKNLHQWKKKIFQRPSNDTLLKLKSQLLRHFNIKLLFTFIAQCSSFDCKGSRIAKTCNSSVNNWKKAVGHNIVVFPPRIRYHYLLTPIDKDGMNCLKWKLSIAMSECKEEKSNNEKWDVFISWMRWKEREKKSSYFDFLQIIHNENSLSIFDNERARANIFWGEEARKVEQTNHFSSFDDGLKSSKHRISHWMTENLSILSGEGGKKKNAFHIRNGKLFSMPKLIICHSFIFIPFSKPIWSKIHYQTTSWVGEKKHVLIAKQEIEIASFWVTSEFFRTDLWRISLREDWKIIR